MTNFNGRDAAAKKYDLLSALSAHGLSSDKHTQKLVLRLISLITTRYNWQRNELAMGQREIARLWCVNERTVKREMAKLRELGWIQTKRHGVRGTVSVLSLNIERILLDSKPSWPNIGQDYIERMSISNESKTIDSPKITETLRSDLSSTDNKWSAMCSHLKNEDPAVFDAWFAPLELAACENEKLSLIAPSNFHASYVRTHFLTRLGVAAKRTTKDIKHISLIS
ncbi:DnaA N-terminal domain-containing protein [Paracoccus sp. JM45]|uniref:DnaA N-terminal domain-containing protein n=1 Tax=Paracoccus sp. JM45 TaxID=2283626 RepID=UPI000E6C4FAD|nr:DnaA N-terminal domain-containing protein [Paracoccus sp. JM45]RJE78803.1 hypothetical protein DWB67_15515 [Paracoccus sp. JM45]